MVYNFNTNKISNFIDVKKDTNTGLLYSNESILKGILHHTNFDGEFIGSDGNNYILGGGLRAQVAKSLGFSEHPTETEARSMMKTFELEAYPGYRFTLHKSLVDEVQSIYKELKKAGVILNEYQGSYCFRAINNPTKKGSKVLSMHSFGCAIDINYNLNGFIGGGRPLSSGDDTRKGIVRTLDSPIVKIFTNHGWGWGGKYGDYMHFSKANGG